jgi:anti-sigma factor RsiW
MSDERTMTCDEVRPLLREKTRGGLDENARVQLDQHLVSCPACRSVADEERDLDRLLEERLPQHAAPLALKRRLRARLPALPAARPDRPFARWRAPAVVLLAACAVLAIGLGLRPSRSSNPLIAEAVADHLRVVYRDHPVDIESGGPHQVKPWFTGRLDFALPAVFGGNDEFTLVGGSVGYYIDRGAAMLVYKRQRHTASLSVFRAAGLSFPETNRDLGRIRATVRQVRGFSVILWRDGDLGYALVSDLNAGELVRLASDVASPS